jgi:hypothetical protein
MLWKGKALVKLDKRNAGAKEFRDLVQRYPEVKRLPTRGPNSSSWAFPRAPARPAGDNVLLQGTGLPPCVDGFRPNSPRWRFSPQTGRLSRRHPGP